MRYLRKPGLSVFLFFTFFVICACGGQAGYSGGGSAKENAFSAFRATAAAPAAAYDLDRLELRASTALDRLELRASTAAEQGTERTETTPFSGEGAGQTRKLVKTAELRLRVQEPGATEEPLAELMKKYGAWSASTGIYENSRSYSIRVPSPSYDAMLAELAGLGKLLRRTENAEDVTLRYYDLEGRLATRQELLRTYQGYLGKAADIGEIMTVESRIAELQYEIEQTGTQFRNLASQVDYSTIEMEIVGPVSASSYSEPGLGEKLKELFASFGDVVSSALVVLTGILIYGIPAVLVLILLFSLFFGRIGLIKKLWRFAAEKKNGGEKREGALTREQAGQPLGAVSPEAKNPEGKKTERGLTQKEAQMLADGALTQDEIELLLAGGPIPSGKKPDGNKPTEILTQEEINYILEAITKGENQAPPPWAKPKPPEGSTK